MNIVWMTDRKQKFWFRAKSYGFGWGLPASWQGWVVFALYLALVFATVGLAPDAARLPTIFMLTVMFIIVVAFKGERPAKWRWGKD